MLARLGGWPSVLASAALAGTPLHARTSRAGSCGATSYSRAGAGAKAATRRGADVRRAVKHGDAVMTNAVYCKDTNCRGEHAILQFDFLGYTFRPRLAKCTFRMV
jgi:hypothetical protein